MSEVKGYAKIRSSWLRWMFRSPVTAIVSHWIFQGFLYMDWGERIFKLLLDAGLAVLFVELMTQWLNIWISVVVAFLFAHTLNFLFNAHLWGALKHYGLVQNTQGKYQLYLCHIQERIHVEESIQQWCFIGSLSITEWTPESDIDLRLVRKGGLSNWFRACFFVMKERSRAFIAHFPMDIYVFDKLSNFLNNPKESRLSEAK